MTDFLPVMLFILAWHPSDPGVIKLEREKVLFGSIEECEREGAKIVAERAAGPDGRIGIQFEHRCIVAPIEREYREALERQSQSGK